MHVMRRQDGKQEQQRGHARSERRVRPIETPRNQCSTLHNTTLKSTHITRTGGVCASELVVHYVAPFGVRHLGWFRTRCCCGGVTRARAGEIRERPTKRCSVDAAAHSRT